MNSHKGFNSVYWLRGYRDGLASIWNKSLEENPVYLSGHLEGVKDRTKTPVRKPRRSVHAMVDRIKENNETSGG